MRFGVRDIANVVFKAKTNTKVGNMPFQAGQPVLYIDTAKTSTLEQATTSVYATGGRGNTRLVTWEGEKTLTFTVEDALLSPIGLAVLSGAGLIHDKDANTKNMVHVHMTSMATTDNEGNIDLTDALGKNDKVDHGAPIFVMPTELDGSLKGEMFTGYTVANDGKGLKAGAKGFEKNTPVFVDYYITKSEYVVHELQIGAENFGGYYYVEADTLFRDQATGKDMPANLTIPNVKIQSNFTFSMAATGDPSTFTFTMDAMPGYTMFDRTKKVLCVIQVIDDKAEDMADDKTVMPHKTGFAIPEVKNDSAENIDDEDETIGGNKNDGSFAIAGNVGGEYEAEDNG